MRDSQEQPLGGPRTWSCVHRRWRWAPGRQGQMSGQGPQHLATASFSSLVLTPATLSPQPPGTPPLPRCLHELSPTLRLLDFRALLCPSLLFPDASFPQGLPRAPHPPAVSLKSKAPQHTITPGGETASPTNVITAPLPCTNSASRVSGSYSTAGHGSGNGL